MNDDSVMRKVMLTTAEAEGAATGVWAAAMRMKSILCGIKHGDGALDVGLKVADIGNAAYRSAQAIFTTAADQMEAIVNEHNARVE